MSITLAITAHRPGSRTLLAAGALVALLGGCMPPGHQAAGPADPHLPFPPEGVRTPSCLGLPGSAVVQASQPGRALHDLAPGARCWFIVQPGRQLGMAGNGTGLALHPRCHYTVTLPQGHRPGPALMAAASESDGAQPVHHGARITGLQGELSFYQEGERASQGQPPQRGNLLVVIQREAEDLQGRGCTRSRS